MVQGDASTRGLGLLMLAMAMAACRADLPSLDWEGERVRVGTDVVDQVCAGTLARLDTEVELIEERLLMQPDERKAEIYVLEPEQIDSKCPDHSNACTKYWGGVLIAAGQLDGSITHELVHARVQGTEVENSVELFDEGLAVALERPHCRRSDLEESSVDELLGVDRNEDLGWSGYWIAGELVHWLLDEHGPTTVLAFMTAVGHRTSPDKVRQAYRDHFGAEIDDDIDAHWRDPEAPVPALEAGCFAPAAEFDPSGARIELSASLDCASPRVHNDFGAPGRAWVEWTLTIGPEQAGTYGLVGELPPDTELRIDTCDCRWDVDLPIPQHESGFSLEPGSYRVRWFGPLDDDVQLDVALQGPCDPVAQDCPDPLVCSVFGECRPAVDDPAAIGEPCEEDTTLACEPGSLCVGDGIEDGIEEGTCVAACSAGLDCPAPTICGPFELCGLACDPLAQDCADAGYGCQLGVDGPSVCMPVGDAGLLDECIVWEFECGPGLTCASFEGCEGWFGGCCTPVCEPDQQPSSCPAELPNCVAATPNADAGVCEP